MLYKETEMDKKTLGIVDELCHCRHLRSEHNDRFDKGHGSCQKCGCGQFTWYSFLYDMLKVQNKDSKGGD